MASKAFLLLGLLFALGLLISSEVSARDLAESSETEAVSDAKYVGGGGPSAPAYGGGPSAPTYGGGPSAPAYGGGPSAPAYGSGDPKPYGGRGGRCGYGCCGVRGYYRCSRCCSYVGEAVDAEPKN